MIRSRFDTTIAILYERAVSQTDIKGDMNLHLSILLYLIYQRAQKLFIRRSLLVVLCWVYCGGKGLGHQLVGHRPFDDAHSMYIFSTY